MKFSDLSLDTLLKHEPGVLYEQALRWRHGDGLGTDLHSARRVFGFLALCRHSGARYQLGVMNLRGEAGVKDKVRALMWFRLAQGRDEPRAASQITMLSDELTGLDARRALKMMVEVKKAVNLLLAARNPDDEGNVPAMAALGAQLLAGVDVDQDASMALEWLQRATQRNNSDAQYHLGLAYAKANGVRKNTTEAVRLLQLSSEQYHREARYHWAKLLEQHPKLIQAKGQVRHLYESSAKQGYAPAQLRLGYLLRGEWIAPPQNLLADEPITVHKKSVFKRHNDPDLISALKYFTRAAEQGNTDAQFEVGQMYAQGLGTAQLFEEAMHWYELSARQGHAKAQFNIAFLYAYGQGVDQDILKAYEWYRISHLCAYPLAKKPMEFTAKKLSLGEIEMADWRADSFVYNLPEREKN
jgi:TPR repeat protein